MVRCSKCQTFASGTLTSLTASLILSQAAPFLRSFDAATVAFAKLEADMNRPTAIDGMIEDTNNESPQFHGTVELRNVNFTFPSRPDNPVLQDLSFTCPAGQQTAIEAYQAAASRLSLGSSLVCTMQTKARSSWTAMM
jgi:ABC-type multidrug transport system fused ATPase/permease subunit